MKIVGFYDNYDMEEGIAVYFKELSSELRKKHKVYVLSFSEKKGIKKEGVFVYKRSEKPFINRFLSMYTFNFRVYSAFKNWLSKVKPDIIHLQHNYKATSAVLMAIRANRIPAVATFHDYTIICPKGWCTRPDGKICSGGCGLKCFGCVPFHHFIMFILTVWLRTFLTKRVVKAYIAPSRMLKKVLERNGFRNIFYVPYSIDLKKWKFNFCGKGSNILFIARLRKEKGTDYLIKAMPLIAKEVPDAKLIIIGEGAEKDNLVKLAKKLGLDNKVKFAGFVPNERIADYYKKANVAVMPSIWMEQFGLVGLEAMASGVPCVGSRIGGIPEWLEDGKNGYLVEPRNSRQIAEKVIKILKNKGLAKKMAVYGRKKAEREFSKEGRVRSIERVYISLAK